MYVSSSLIARPSSRIQQNNNAVAIILISALATTRGAMAESKIVGEEGAAATIIGLLTSISVVVYSFVHVCCCQTTLASKRFLVFSTFSVAWYVCAIGAFYGSEDSFIEAQCSLKVDCHHAHTGYGCDSGARICHEPTVDRDDPWGNGQYYTAWFYDDCWDHGGGDHHCRVFDTQEECMKFKGHGSKNACDGFSHSEAWEFSMFFLALPQVFCALFLVVGILLTWKSSMSPLNMKDIDELAAATPTSAP